jgi:hypothetical protein
LLANAACQSTSIPQTHRHRGQARSYNGCAGLPIKARHRFSAGCHIKARHRFSGGCHIKATHKTCRSRLAGERGVSADINSTDPPPSRASALLHRCAAADISRQDTGFAADAISKPHTKPVGAGLLANAACQATSMPQTHRHRGQARSYTGVRCPPYQGKTLAARRVTYKA